MATIDSSDIIYASIRQHGRLIASYTFSGVSSLVDLLRQVRRAADGCIGLVTVNLRNRNQGWCQNRSMMLTPVTEAVQLSLF